MVSAVNPSVADLGVIRQLTNLNDINRLLHETIAAERAVDAELDKQLGKRDGFERSLLMLNTSTSDGLELVRADSEQLATGVAGTAQTAQRIGTRVRQLDHVHSNMQATLDLVNLILDRTNCVTGVQAAMAQEDYDQAASYISKFLELEQQLSAAAQGMDTGQVEEQRQLLLAAKGQLEQVVSAKLEEATAARNHANVLKYVLLHKPLGNAAQGLSKYTRYLCIMLGSKGRELYDTLSEALDTATTGAAAAAAAAKGKAPVMDVAGALIGLFRAVAVAVEQDEEVITSTYGPAALFDVVVAAQSECDRQGVRILARYLEAKRVPQLVAEAQSNKGGGSANHAAAAGAASSRLEPRKLEPLVQEIVLLLQRADEYSSFMLGKMQDRLAVAAAVAAAAEQQPKSQQRRSSLAEEGELARSSSIGNGATTDAPAEHAAIAALKQQLAAAEAKLKAGQLSVAVRELVAQYVALEEYYMEETASIAISRDTLVPAAVTTSMVDDVFFILKKCGARALATTNVQCACALLGQLNDVLANRYKAALAARLAGGAGQLVAAAPSMMGLADAAAGGPVPAAAQEQAVAINNVDVSAEYVTKLRQELDGYAERAFALPTERERVGSVLADLTKTGNDFQALTTKALEGVSEALLARMRPIFEEVGMTSYQLGDADYGAADGEVSWVMHLLAALDSQRKWLQDLLTSSGWEALFQILLDKVLARLEALLNRKPFTQLGGLQLDKDLRALVAAAGEMAAGAVRDKFSRLNQMAIVLSLESVEEFLDYWGDDMGHVTWRLTPAEVRGILKQRVDFSKEAIASLPL